MKYTEVKTIDYVDVNTIFTIKENDKYKIFGDAIDHNIILDVMSKLVGLPYHSYCGIITIVTSFILNHKYRIKTDYITGSTIVSCASNKTTYGFEYKPPFEFHAWLQFSETGILDVSVPGLIWRGLNTRDEHGAFLENIDEIIINGFPPPYIKYTPYSIYTSEFVDNFLNDLLPELKSDFGWELKI